MTQPRSEEVIEGKLELVQVPPPEAAPKYPLSIEYGVPPFLRTEERSGMFRCHGCNQFQMAGSPLVWVPDFVYSSDLKQPLWVWEELARTNAFNGHFTGICVGCAKSIGKTSLFQPAKYDDVLDEPIIAVAIAAIAFGAMILLGAIMGVWP